MRRHAGGILLAAALVAVVGWPSLALGWRAWAAPASPFQGAGGLARPLSLAVNTLEVVGLAEVLAVPLGVGLALLAVRTDMAGRGPLLGALGLAILLPMPLHATAWVGALGNLGRSQALGASPALVGWVGAGVVHALAALPWVVALAGLGLMAVEPELEESALMDRRGASVVWKVTLRRSIGGIAASAVAVGVLTAGDMTITDLLQVRTYAEEVYIQSHLNDDPTAAARSSLPPLLLIGGLIAWGGWRLSRGDPSRVASRWPRSRTWRLGRWRWPLGAVAGLSTAALVGFPLYASIWRAGRVGAGPGRPPAWSLPGLIQTLVAASGEMAGPLGKSALIAAGSASLATLIAWPLAWRCRRSTAWRAVAVGAATLGLATPGPLVGLAYKVAYMPYWIVKSAADASAALGLARPGPLVWLAERFADLPWWVASDTPVILIMAVAARTIPYALLALWPAVRGLPDAYLMAAEVDGLTRSGVARRVALPLTAGATAAAWGLAFVLGVGELPASLVVEPPGTVQLASVRVWGLLHTGVDSRLAGVGLVCSAVVGGAGLAAAWGLGRAYRGGSSAGG